MRSQTAWTRKPTHTGSPGESHSGLPLPLCWGPRENAWGKGVGFLMTPRAWLGLERWGRAGVALEIRRPAHPCWGAQLISRKGSLELWATGLFCLSCLPFGGLECPSNRLPLPGPGIQPIITEGTVCLRVAMNLRAVGRRAAGDGGPPHAGPGTSELCP